MSITVKNNCNTKQTTKIISVGPVQFFPGINVITDESALNQLRINPGFVRYLRSDIPDSTLKILAVVAGSLDKAVIVEKKEPVKSTPAPVAPIEDDVTREELTDAINLCEIEGISDNVAESLIEFGIKSIEDVANSNIEILIAVNGIGAKSAPKILESAQALIAVKNQTETPPTPAAPLTEAQAMLQGNSVEDAIGLVKMTMQRDLLNELNVTEARPEVKKAIADQIELLAV